MSGHNHFSALAVAVWIMAGSMVTEANSSGGKGGGNMGRLLKGLNLTTEQKHRTEEVVQGHHSDLITGKMAVLQARQNLLTAMNSDGLDERAVQSAFRTLTSAEENLTVLRARILNEVMPVLTPYQQTAVRNKVAKISLRIQRSVVRLQSKLNSPLVSDGKDNTRVQQAANFHA